MQRAASLLTPIWGVNSRPLVGMVHLLPLPGAPRWDGSMAGVIGRARADAAALAAGGFHGVMVENFLDAPFHPAAVPAETVAAMAVIVDRVREECGLPVGVNVLRNDAYAALAIAAATSARFIRVNVHTGAMLTDQGWLDGRAHETLRTRLRLAPDVAILADVLVKHAVAPAGLTAGDAARDSWHRGLADALIVSGTATGAAVDTAQLDDVRSAVPDAPVWLGSGVDAGNAAALLERADGAIIGSALAYDGVAGNGIDPARVRRFTAALGLT